MTTYQQPAPGAVMTARPYRKGSILADWLSSTDHKVIGHLYLITSFFFFMCGGAMAMIMRAQLMGPDNSIVSDQQYNELFTMHGIIMLIFFATPLFVGFANEIMPLQIGAPDVAFPRLNLLSYYFFLFSGLIMIAKSDAAMLKLSAQIKARKVHKGSKHSRPRPPDRKAFRGSPGSRVTASAPRAYKVLKGRSPLVQKLSIRAKARRDSRARWGLRPASLPDAAQRDRRRRRAAVAVVAAGSWL